MFERNLDRLITYLRSFLCLEVTVIKARVYGAGGFGGANIIDLLLAHPEVEIVSLVSLDGVGKPISNRHTYLKGFCDLPIESPDQADWSKGAVDVVFSSTPDGVGMNIARKCMQAGAKLIDYSGDFRFNSLEDFTYYATRLDKDPEHAAPELLEKSAYGLAELHREEIQSSTIVGNPGCFAVSVILGYAPAVKANLVDTATLIADAKTGISGAGIKPKPTFHYPLRYENMNAYKIANHQHNIEIERELSLLHGSTLQVTFTPQVVPLCRGILSTLYGRLNNPAMGADELYDVYASFYKDSPYVRVEKMGTPVSNNDVRGSNQCVISVNCDTRTGQIIIVSHIDNLMKGQAGSALQNMNIMFGLDENLGLTRPPYYP